MQITLLGTGTPSPNPKRRGPGHLITCGDNRFLIDCGSGVVHQMVQVGVSPIDIDHLLLTHLHSDHFIDIGHFIVTRWIVGDDRVLNVYGPEGTRHVVERTLEMLAPDIRLRMRIQKEPREFPNVMVHELDAGPALDIDGVKATAFLVDHWPLEQPFGYRFDTKDRSVVISGDTAPSENLIRHAHGVDLLVHECVANFNVPHDPGYRWTPKQYVRMKDSHTPPDLLGLVARDAAPGMVVTTHMSPGTEPLEMREAIGRGFAGAVAIGEDLVTV